ncbi:uncharacterized protein LOC126313329 [Schistocerca gregaria]|uniref:uncharacterized protein LOC126313329 n=1 Tax=Schistocerca gregaria TaxID=7010 RepID=UPI00211DA832|nr:uncharacterized protein LOC126313329 [Schistocerca gregaria]
MSFYSVKALLILDSVSGTRVVAKYFSFDDKLTKRNEQLEFEKSLFAKINTQRAEITFLDEYVALYKAVSDFTVCVIGTAEENEIILLSTLNIIIEALTLLLGEQIDKRVLVDHLDCILLIFDEIVDDGIIFELDLKEIIDRISIGGSSEGSLGEQIVSEAVKTLRKHARNLLMG